MKLRIRPDSDRDGPFHRAIVESSPIPDTRTGKVCRLSCGHVVKTFGGLALLGPDAKVLCERCEAEAASRGSV